MTHPIQPIVVDEFGVERFKPNAIVRYLLDSGGISMDDIARLNFSREDHEQFAQLIGYSWCGANDLPYLFREVLDAAKEMNSGIPAASMCEGLSSAAEACKGVSAAADACESVNATAADCEVLTPTTSSWPCDCPACHSQPVIYRASKDICNGPKQTCISPETTCISPETQASIRWEHSFTKAPRNGSTVLVLDNEGEEFLVRWNAARESDDPCWEAKHTETSWDCIAVCFSDDDLYGWSPIPVRKEPES
jgi:hypothetical protein